MPVLKDTRSLCETLGDEFVHVFVGRERKKFAVHRALICSQSAFFNDAFIEADPASLKTELHLPYDSASIFEIYMGWMYRGHLVFKVFEGDDEEFTAHNCIDLCLFAEQKLCTPLQNAAMDLFQDSIRDGVWSLNYNLLSKIFCLDDSDDIDHLFHVREFCCAVLYHYFLVTQTWGPQYMTGLFQQCPEAMEAFLEFQVKMSQKKDIKTSDPQRRGNSTLYHCCFFHLHDSNEDEDACRSEHSEEGRLNSASSNALSQ
ncbi:hypothetical protein BGZ57DRAFT_984981 [Hyaloscypha finlandica]|nr:hypothetical protein BGZ57DRAFT_984981 [Hyaloscypha finlandica]